MSVLSEVLMACGVALLFVGGVGLLRFEDIYSRLQAAGVSDVGGTALLLLGLMVRSGGWEKALLSLLLLFLLFTGPVATHSIAKGAFLRGHPPGERRA